MVTHMCSAISIITYTDIIVSPLVGEGGECYRTIAANPDANLIKSKYMNGRTG